MLQRAMMALLILDSVRGTIGLIMPAGRALGTDWLLRSGPRCVRCIRAGSATFRGSMIADKRVSAQAKGSCMEAGTQDALEHASRFTSSATNAAEALTELWTLIGASRTVDHDANANTTTYVVKFASLTSQEPYMGTRGHIAGNIVMHLQDVQEAHLRMRAGSGSRLPEFEVSLLLTPNSAEVPRVILHLSHEPALRSSGLNAHEEEMKVIMVGQDTLRGEEVHEGELLKVTQDWVAAMISPQNGMGLCPFTATATHGGRPKANIHYAVVTGTGSREELAMFYRALWKEAADLIALPERERSTSLLVTVSDSFYHGASDASGKGIALFNLWTRTVTPETLEQLQLNTRLHLVTFHPQFYQQTGQAAKPAHYARRSPYPIINWVRAHQIDAAQSALGMGYVFAAQNEGALAGVGVTQLQDMLERNSWSNVPKVDRSIGAHPFYFPSHYARFWLPAFSYRLGTAVCVTVALVLAFHFA